MTGQAPKEVEQITDSLGNEYVTRWFCDRPVPGVLFRITREEWNADNTVRDIYEVALDPEP
jgi:hypothetical protein